MSDQPERTYDLVLHIRIPTIFADDLIEHARIYFNLDDDIEPTPKQMAEVVLAEWMRPDVGITFVTLPGEDDFMVVAAEGRIVGAEVRLNPRRGAAL